MMNPSHQHRAQIWLLLSPLFFGLAGLASVVITDLVFTPATPLNNGVFHALNFSKEPIFLLSTSIPPALFAFLATYLWLIRGIQFFGGWLSIAAAAWFSLAINPIIWVLVAASFFLYGFVVLGVLFLAGIVLHIAWRFNVA